MKTIQQVDMSSIKVDPNQPRKVVNEASVAHLAQSLSVEGLIHPVEVDESHMLIVGEMRYRAAKSLGWKFIYAHVRSTPLSPYERLRRQMAENLQQSGSKGGGQPMNPVDTAKAWARLYEVKTGKDYSAAQASFKETYGVFTLIGKEVGVSYHTIYQELKLLLEKKTIIEDLMAGRPRTYYTEANKAPKEMRDTIKKNIAKGKYINRDQIEETIHLAKQIPDLARMNMERNFTKESQGVNRILSSIINLSLALVSIKLKDINEFEQNMVRQQLEWIQEKIISYLGGI